MTFLLKEDPSETIAQLSEQTGKNRRTIQRKLDNPTESGFLRRCGSARKGYWEIMIDSPEKP